MFSWVVLPAIEAVEHQFEPQVSKLLIVLVIQSRNGRPEEMSFAGYMMVTQAIICVHYDRGMDVTFLTSHIRHTTAAWGFQLFDLRQHSPLSS